MDRTKIYRMKASRKTVFRYEKGSGWLSSSENGKDGTWHFTQRTDDEILLWCEADDAVPNDAEAKRDAELELFGDTLDEPLPDDLVEMLGIL